VHAINSSIACTELKSVQFWLICFTKFGCHGNSLGFLEILDSILEFVDPENLAIDGKIVSISCTEMKLCLFEYLAIFTIALWAIFFRFLRKIVEIAKKNLTKPQMVL